MKRIYKREDLTNLVEGELLFSNRGILIFSKRHHGRVLVKGIVENKELMTFYSIDQDNCLKRYDNPLDEIEINEGEINLKGYLMWDVKDGSEEIKGYVKELKSLTIME